MQKKQKSAGVELGPSEYEERLVREEIRSITSLTLHMFQTGIALLAGLETALVIVRKSWLDVLVANGDVPEKTSVLPPVAYAFGTAMLFVVALIFMVLCTL